MVETVFLIGRTEHIGYIKNAARAASGSQRKIHTLCDRTRRKIIQKFSVICVNDY